MTDGILAIWNDCAAGHEAAYESWYMHEHLPERLSVPGFRHGRRYEALGPGPRFFTYYDTDRPEVMATAAYLERVENPTPLTRRIMGAAFLNMNRTICRVVARHGRARGAVAAVLRLDPPAETAHLAATLAELSGDPAIARAELWLPAEIVPAVETTESRLRGGDATIQGCLFADCLREADAARVLDHLTARHAGTPGLYRLLAALDA